MKLQNKRFALVVACTLALTAVAVPQLNQVLRAGGVVAVISAFGKDMNDAMNKLWNRRDDPFVKTKIVPILTVTGSRNNAIGAAQVMGPPQQVERVVAVAQPEARVPGIGVRVRAMIPVSSQNVVENIRAVPEVGVSGIVDIRL
ncbi:MAG: hypothetical protein SNJ76_12975 [Fimbriimonadaceae bacterium]